jgi:mRNA-degrading endonuclease toxin of MazEF toxin-antitoxin module
VVSCDNVTTIPAEALRDQIGVLLDQELQLSAAIRAHSASIEYRREDA